MCYAWSCGTSALFDWKMPKRLELLEAAAPVLVDLYGWCGWFEALADCLDARHWSGSNFGSAEVVGTQTSNLKVEYGE